MQNEVVWTCLPFIKSGQHYLARHSERGKKTRQTEKEVGRRHQGMDRPGVLEVPDGSKKQRKMEETGCEVIYGAPMTSAVKGLVKVKVGVCVQVLILMYLPGGQSGLMGPELLCC